MNPNRIARLVDDVTSTVAGRFLRNRAVSAAALLLVAALVAGSANLARAQESGGGAGAGPSTSASPDKLKKIPNFAGCWNGSDGSLADMNYGTGTGWIGIVQNGKKIKSSSGYEFLWDNDAFAYGPLSGTAGVNGFKLSGKAGGDCRIIIVGGFGESDDIIGAYHTNGAKSCKKENLDAAGTFDLPYDPSGCELVTPP